ncbi:MAG: tRNA (guanine-N7)-methyltransferase [Polyangiaceae bacterium]
MKTENLAPPGPDARVRAPRPYSDAPRIPEGEFVDLRTLVSGSRYELEVGSGRGGFTLERILHAPEVGMLALEIKRKWASIVDKRLRDLGHSARARCFSEDAKFALPRLGPSGTLSVVYLHFPDPWWKKRHQKRLVMGEVFLREVLRLLEPGGELFVQTDVDERAEAYCAQLQDCPELAPAGDAPGSPWLAENPYGARSPREHRAIKDGLPVRRMRFRRK